MRTRPWWLAIGFWTAFGSAGAGSAAGQVLVDTVQELADAVAAANAGGPKTILVADGTYTLGNMLWISAQNVTVRSASGNRAAVVLRGAGMTTGNVTHIFNVAGSGFSVRDMTLRNVRNHAIQLQPDVDNVRIQNLHILDTFEQMVKVAYVDGSPASSDDGLVEGCLFEYSAGIGPQFYIGGIDAHRAKRWIVRNNTFRNIRSPSGSVAEHAIHFWSDSEDTLVERNRILTCDRGIGFGLGDRGHLRGIIRNNVLYHDSSGGFADVGIGLESAPGAQLYNNTVFHENSYPNAIEYRFAETTGVLIANNLTNRAIVRRDNASGSGTNNVTSAQASWFVAPASGDVHLRTAVPAVVDQGMSISGLTGDFDGDFRPQGGGIDIGADEMVVTSPTPAPAALGPAALTALLAALAWLGPTRSARHRRLRTARQQI